MRTPENQQEKDKQPNKKMDKHWICKLRVRKSEPGAPGWLSWLSVRLWLRSWSHGSWVWALRWVVCWQLRAWSLPWILCLPLSLPLPCLLTLVLSRSLKNKNIKKNFLRRVSQGVPGWFSRLCRRLRLRSWSQVCEFKPGVGSVLTAQSLEPASNSVSPSLSGPPPFTLCLSKINKH